MCFLDSTDLNNLFGPGEFNAGVKAVMMAVHKLRKGAHKNEAQGEISGLIELVSGAPVPKSKLLGPKDPGSGDPPPRNRTSFRRETLDLSEHFNNCTGEYSGLCSYQSNARVAIDAEVQPVEEVPLKKLSSSESGELHRTSVRQLIILNTVASLALADFVRTDAESSSRLAAHIRRPALQ